MPKGIKSKEKSLEPLKKEWIPPKVSDSDIKEETTGQTSGEKSSDVLEYS